MQADLAHSRTRCPRTRAQEHPNRTSHSNTHVQVCLAERYIDERALQVEPAQRRQAREVPRGVVVDRAVVRDVS